MFESVSLAFQGIFTHKLRSFLTMLGIIIGIASIIAIISTIQGTNEQIKQNLIGAGNNVVSVQLYQNDWTYDLAYSNNPVGVQPASEEDKAALRRLDGVEDVTFYHVRNYADNIFYGNTQFSGTLFGIDDSYFSVNGYQIKRGRDFTARDVQNHLKNVILDETAAKSLFGSADPIGKVIEFSGEPFSVVGVVTLKSDFEPTIETEEDYYLYMDQSGGRIYIPDGVWPTVYRFDEPYSIAVRAASTDDMTRVGKAAADYLDDALISDYAAQQGFSYRSDDLLEQAEQLQQMSNSSNQQLIWIASISLLVGGVGVMNIMLVTVTERTGEIGLKKAIGAKRRRILAQFLTESSVLTGVGGILGVLCGIGLSVLRSEFMDAPSAVSIPAVLGAVVFSILIGLLFGMIPAVKASKLNPIEALRRE